MRTLLPWRPIFIGILLGLILGNLGGCEYLPFGYTPIQEIVTKPTEFENREVKVQGTVKDLTKIPFFQTKFYVLSQDGYQIFVLTDETIPTANSHVTVVGVVQNIAVIGNESIGVHIREVKRVKPLMSLFRG